MAPTPGKPERAEVHLSLAARRKPGADELVQAQLAKLRRRIDAVAAERRRLADLYQGDFIDRDELLRRGKELQERRNVLYEQGDALRAQREQLAQHNAMRQRIAGFSSVVRATIDHLDFEQRQKLLRLVVDQVCVSGWRVEIKLQIPLDEPPAPPGHGLSSKDRLRSVSDDHGRELPAAREAPRRRVQRLRYAAGAGGDVRRHIQQGEGSVFVSPGGQFLMSLDSRHRRDGVGTLWRMRGRHHVLRNGAGPRRGQRSRSALRTSPCHLRAANVASGCWPRESEFPRCSHPHDCSCPRIYYGLDSGRAALHRIGVTQNLSYAAARVGDFDREGRDDVLLRHADTGDWIYHALDGRRAVLQCLGATRNLAWAAAGREPEMAPPTMRDYGDTEATAMAVGVPSITLAPLETSEDTDYFRIELPGSGRLRTRRGRRTRRAS